MSPLRPRRGQIVIPALLIFPALALFVYLIYETAKLSREKIRHQFALDAAAFVEMANYSDFLNRTAYVNGAFPMRIFQESYSTFPMDCEQKWDKCQATTYGEVLFRNGAYPRSAGDPNKSEFTGEGRWDIEYEPGKQSGLPDLGGHDPLWLFTQEDANHYWHSIELATDIYKLYRNIYSLLGQVEEAQRLVLEHLTKQGSPQHNFLAKSYYLNTGDSLDEGAKLSGIFDVAMGGDFMSALRPACLHAISYCGNRHVGGTGLQVYRPECAENVPLDQPSSPSCESQGGLFQMMWVDPSMISRLRDSTGGTYPGLALNMNWAVPSGNYWNVDFTTLHAFQTASGSPEIHTTISIRGDSSASPKVWPDPTPKFQVREFP